MNFLLNRLKVLVLALIGAFRRALCCFRARRKSYDNGQDECLTDVGVVPNKNESDFNSWDSKWGDEVRRPQTIQDHIQMYRDKIAQPNVPEPNRSDEVLDNLFQELTPQYVAQKRVLINSGRETARQRDSDLSRLSVSEGGPAADLGEWLEESGSGWDEQHVDPMDMLKEQRRLKRETRQQQNVGLGKKLKT